MISISQKKIINGYTSYRYPRIPLAVQNLPCARSVINLYEEFWYFEIIYVWHVHSEQILKRAGNILTCYQKHFHC